MLALMLQEQRQTSLEVFRIENGKPFAIFRFE